MNHRNSLLLDKQDIDTCLRSVAIENPESLAVADSKRRLYWHEFDKKLNQAANAFISAGLKPNDHIALLGLSSIDYLILFLGGLRAGLCIVPLSTLTSSNALANMIDDSGSKILFVDEGCIELIEPVRHRLTGLMILGCGVLGAKDDCQFLDKESYNSVPVNPSVDWRFNLIYSSGTTGLPKGIMQSRRYRALEAQALAGLGFDKHSRALISTPLYSNTSLFMLFGILANGGAVFLMEKFTTNGFLEISERENITHTVLVPVQYERLLKDPGLDSADLSSYQFKCSTSAPLHKPVKQQILKRWPQGGLWEFYGMTEGGINCALAAHERPDKLDTVGQASAGCDIRIIDEHGNELPQGEVGEIVGTSDRIMDGYHNQPKATEEASWFNSQGVRYHRSGDIGWFDDEGFLHLLDRKKDMIISGGFNVYAIDLEKVLLSHSDIVDVAVIAAPSEQWGETPLAFVVLAPNADFDAEELRQWANGQLGRAQRISEVRVIDELPRSPIGKVLKRELRDGFLECCNKSL